MIFAPIASGSCGNAGRRILLNHELRSRQFGETAAFRHQFIESSSFDYSAAIEHEDARGIAYGRKAMSDHKCGASLHHLVERGVELGFGNRIERAGRLV